MMLKTFHGAEGRQQGVQVWNGAWALQYFFLFVQPNWQEQRLPDREREKHSVKSKGEIFIKSKNLFLHQFILPIAAEGWCRFPAESHTLSVKDFVQTDNPRKGNYLKAYKVTHQLIAYIINEWCTNIKILKIQIIICMSWLRTFKWPLLILYSILFFLNT